MTLAYVFLAFLVMLGMMLVGIPIAVAMVAIGVVGGLITFGMPLVESMGSVIWASLNQSLLTAIPLFILLGELLLRGGIADRMFYALAIWMNRLPGGLLHTNIASSSLFAATSGSSVATAATIGTLALPTLEKRGYPMGPALGSLAAGGTLGILIPPSVNLLVFGSLANVSVGQLFLAGVIPGIALTLLFSLYLLVSQWGKSYGGEEPRIPLSEKLKASKSLVPPLVIFFIVMGSIYAGLATPTESAALGVVTALLFVWHGGRLNLELLESVCINSARTTGMVLLVIICALMLNVTVSLTGVAQTLTQWVVAFDLSVLALLLILIVFYILLGMFMDVMSMLVLTVPVAMPIVMAAGIDPIWFGIFIILMCEIGLITPPVGMNLYVVHGVRPSGGDFREVMWGAFPFVIILLLFTFLLIAFPDIALWLPRNMMG
jgi:C4-dicarboxylate transporter, DctM subunit